MFVKIFPKCKRAKSRVAEHGEVMLLAKVIPGKFMVYSLENTWRDEQWAGWFTDDEASFEEIERE